MSKRFGTILKSLELRASLVRIGSMLVAVPLGFLLAAFLTSSLAGTPLIGESGRSHEELESELAETKAQLREIHEALKGVRDYEVRPSSSRKKGGQGGAPEQKSETLDALLERLQRIQSEEIEFNPIELARRTPMGFPAAGELTSGYGWRSSPFSGRSQLHGGIDISAKYRSPITATADGVVREAGWRSGFGLSVVIDHGAGLETLYAHLAKVTVKVGQKVGRGEKVGLLGSSGNSTGPHLHYEVRKNGVAQNPLPFITLANNLKEIFATPRS